MFIAREGFETLFSAVLFLGAYYWPARDPNLPAFPERDFYTDVADEISYRFGLGPAFNEWLRKEGPKLGAEKMIDLAKQFAEHLQQGSTKGHADGGSGGPMPPSPGQQEAGPLEINVRGQKFKIPDFVVQGELRLNWGQIPSDFNKWLRNR
ncbi:MAG: hypothetical protein HY913_18830 [Desulfomonile tiedjei]|nr:hypothetical protein [Desulfomonile tiedjei]